MKADSNDSTFLYPAAPRGGPGWFNNHAIGRGLSDLVK